VRDLTDDTFRLDGTGDPEADIPDRIYPVQALHSFLGECDVVVVTVPLTADTHHLINGAALKAMKPDALLINVARGDVIHEEALIKALKEGMIAGAGLDVFSEEPLPEDSPLWELPNVLMSPHVSGFTPHYDDRATDLFAENLRRFIVGEELMNVVDREKGY
jgi:phosphoglycerate dehydrogenase-like enzyme